MAKENDLLAEPPEAAPLPDTMGLEHTLSPVDLPPPDEAEARPLLWTSTVIAIAAIFLALFNATAIRGWAVELTPGPYTQRVVELADGWYATTDSVGLTRPVETMSRGWENVKALEFGGEDEAVEDEVAPADRKMVAPPVPSDDDEPRPGFSVG